MGSDRGPLHTQLPEGAPERAQPAREGRTRARDGGALHVHPPQVQPQDGGQRHRDAEAAEGGQGTGSVPAGEDARPSGDVQHHGLGEAEEQRCLRDGRAARGQGEGEGGWWVSQKYLLVFGRERKVVFANERDLGELGIIRPSRSKLKVVVCDEDG